MAEQLIDRPYVYGIVRDRLADILEIDASNVTENSAFVEDLQADSLALIELVESLESEIRQTKPEFRIEDEDLEDLRTVRDAVDYVVTKAGN
jgi:acyl carrier protein